MELIFKRSVVASHMPANVEHLLLTPALFQGPNWLTLPRSFWKSFLHLLFMFWRFVIIFFIKLFILYMVDNNTTELEKN